MKAVAMATLSDLLQELDRQDPALPLVFETSQGEISPGYHVTELRQSASTGIDCGGHIETWTDARLQLLDGRGETHMSVAKFTSIVGRGLAALPALADAPLMVEFGHDNVDLRVMAPGSPERVGAQVVIALGHARAVCKPAQKARSSCGGAGAGAPSGCCA